MSIFGKDKDTGFGIEEIRKLLPHRYPFLFIDKVLSCDVERGMIVGIKNVTINEQFFQGHFPSRPIMPGVIIVEAMAQVAGICALKIKTELQGNLFFFLGIEEAKFRAPVVPGDTLIIEAELSKERSNVFKFKCTAKVGDKLVTEAIITAQGTNTKE
jgi:beta-hydroxyacyl-ACP dehydratase FabZ